MIKATVFWSIMSCSLVDRNTRIGGTCFLHL
jgi:hypothetical protein